MKKTILIFIIAVVLLVCGGVVLMLVNKNNETETVKIINDNIDENITVTNDETKINIQVGNKNIKATLDNSETTNDFIKLLPLTINMTNFYDREYAGGLGTSLSTNGEEIETFENGDVTYYVVGRSLAIFFDKANESTQSDLIRMGKITSSLEDFKDLDTNSTFVITLDDSASDVATGEEQIVLDRLKEYQQAMIDKDMNKLNEMVLDGTTFTHMSGKTQTKEEFLGEIEDGTLNYYKAVINNSVVTVNGNEALVQATTTLTAKVYGASGEWTLNTNARFEKIDGIWYFGRR